MSRTGVSKFGGKKRLPRVVRRLIVVAAVGCVTVSCVALAWYVRPQRSTDEEVAELEAVCETIQEDGENTPGEYASCMGEVSHMKAMALRH